ncbi:MAG: hypothetical protein VW707_07515, partial [Candidatus Puniceispirillum sp.]
DAKSVLRLTCKPYDSKIIQELDSVDISVDAQVPYETLDSYFQELIDTNDAQDIEAEVTPQVTVNVNNTKVVKPIVDKSEDDVEENFADGKKKGRKGLSKRVGVSQKMSISKLAKIAKTASGERKRMAQWNLNMKRGRKKKK